MKLFLLAALALLAPQAQAAPSLPSAKFTCQIRESVNNKHRRYLLDEKFEIPALQPQNIHEEDGLVFKVWYMPNLNLDEKPVIPLVELQIWDQLSGQELAHGFTVLNNASGELNLDNFSKAGILWHERATKKSYDFQCSAGRE
jgi:hypothetical protein